MTGANLEEIRRVYERWGEGDLTASLDVLASDAVLVMRPEFPDAGTYEGIATCAPPVPKGEAMKRRGLLSAVLAAAAFRLHRPRRERVRLRGERAHEGDRTRRK